MDHKDLQYAHKKDCSARTGNKPGEEHRNNIAEDGYVVEYDCYCKECGAYLYSFAYGHYER